MSPKPTRRGTSAAELLRVGDLHFRVRCSGTESRHLPFVLVHGIGMSHRYLRDLQEALGRERRVLTVDLPGHGGLPRPARDVGVIDMAVALDEALATAGATHAVFVGHSMGAQWVTELARMRPAAAAGVVLIGPVADRRHRTFGAQARALAIDTMRESPRANAMVLTDYVRCGIRWYSAQLRHMLAYPLERRVRDLAAPLLVVRGARDPIAGRDWCLVLCEASPSGSLVEVEGGPHVVQVSDPEEVAGALSAFAAGLAPG